jgi:glycosyltransferase involved in cell wall biosynthesis
VLVQEAAIPVRVGIDASVLLAAKQPSGVHRYLWSMVSHLVPMVKSEGIHLTLYAIARNNAGPHARSAIETLSSYDNVTWRIAPFARGWRRIGMGLAMQADRLDVFHYPSPMFRGYCPRPSVVTVHDLAALSVEPQYVTEERRYLPDALVAIRRATSIIAVSHSAAQEVAKHCGRDDAHIILEGVDTSFFAGSTPQAEAALLKQFGNRPFVLCVGTLQARKNHVRLIHAFEQIQSSVPHDLLIVGGEGSGVSDVRQHLAEHPNPRVRLLGYLDDDLLPALYAAADAVALVSLWEGFGLPVLEAMACGTPVLSSHTSALKEVADGAALLVDPYNTKQIAQQLRLILTDHNVRRRLIQQGLTRARQFTWETAARATIEVYRRTAASPGT